ncbi:hypothetical protein HMPREF0860_0052 [Treponema socranskii subsp. socranskii VPI DR56BR1116 = ATCC 35536]|uniref:Uncharacterized protein n=1 Tax=Treponema socranskii subsp. socranskii VPI DR56BR1116 = ATCC 35536 TaxID=1125725 RepID=U1FBP1_TRESO|nr:hypothetical protein HMPREF1325_2300 [Treponema socranskii subsp. socranskii VPI DR56BR1116 = ATCC 35536]ERK02562.1 hypothetical protein HMPREF0860_0052 [Treponema socranskii subsp. socranskii VPI DR56BR1116 = ATCC 35536]
MGLLYHAWRRKASGSVTPESLTRAKRGIRPNEHFSNIALCTEICYILVN